MQDVICPYCGRKAVYTDSSEVYRGRSYGMIYLCRPCSAWVRVHRGTDKPKGRLADAELRKWKTAAHEAFDPLWQIGKFKRRRDAAYAWLAVQMGLPKEQTHIGMFDVDQCKRVIQIIKERT